MYEKALFITIALYALSFSVLAVQFLILDPYGITLTNFNGDELKNPVTTSINQFTLNATFVNFTKSDYTIVDQAAAFLKAGGVLVQLLAIMTGTYIFQVVFLMIGGGGPCCDSSDTAAYLIVGGLFAVYWLLVGRAIIAYIRGI